MRSFFSPRAGAPHGDATRAATARAREGERADKDDAKRRRTHLGLASMSDGDERGLLARGECPVCGRSFTRVALAVHAATCGDTRAARSSVRESERERETAMVSETTAAETGTDAGGARTPSRADAADADAGQGRTAPKRNAMAELMQGARRVEVFELWLDARSRRFAARWETRTLASGSAGAAPGADSADPLANVRAVWRKQVSLGRGAEKRLVDLVMRGADAGGLALGEAGSAPLACAQASPLSVGLLKSMMQKAFRRRDADTVRRCASELAAKSWSDLVRRVPVVLVEDGVAHPEMGALVWFLMADAAKLSATPPVARFVVDVFANAAAGLVRDAEWARVPDDRKPRSSARDGAGGGDDTLVRCLLARADFGGMAGDEAMLRKAARLWRSRFAAHGARAWEDALRAHLAGASPVDALPALVGLAQQRVLEIPSAVAAVDMHVDAREIAGVAELAGATRDAGFSPDRLRAAMWHYRSGLNHRHEEEEGAALTPGALTAWAVLRRGAAEARRDADAMERLDDAAALPARAARDPDVAALASLWVLARRACERVSREHLLRAVSSARGHPPS